MKLIYSVNTRPDAIGKSHKSKLAVDTGWKKMESSVEDFLQYAAVDGKAIFAGVLKNTHKVKENVSEFSTLIVDVDNDGLNGFQTFKAAQQNDWLKENAVCMWSSPNDERNEEGTKYQGQDRYRILFHLKEPYRIADPMFNKEGHRSDSKYIASIVKGLHKMIDGGDIQMNWVNCVFGTQGAKKIHIFEESNILDINDVPVEDAYEPKERDVVTGIFSGEVSDSIRNIRDKFLPHIPSDGYENWKSVCSMLANCAYHTIGYEAGLELFQEWCLKDYPESNSQENQNIFDRLYDSPGEGPSFGALKRLAEDNGYQPSEMVKVEDTDIVEMFGSTDGYIVPSTPAEIVISSLREPPTQTEIITVRNEVEEKPKATQVRIMLEKLYAERNKIRFNQLSNEIEILGKTLAAHEFDCAEHYIDRQLGIMVSPTAAKSALKTCARDNQYHPVKEYLDCVGKSDIPSMDLDLVTTKCLGISSEDHLAIAQVNAWLCGAVSKAMVDEGSTFIEVLTLFSERQGIGKSEFFKSLASPDWFSDSFATTDAQNKDAILMLHTSWINEIAEVDQYALNKSDFKQLKSLVSTTNDTIRVPYGANMERKPRRFVLGATTNSDAMYNQDDQQRRFWTLAVQPSTSCGRLDIQWLQDNRDAIWATAVRRYWELGDESYKLSKEHREETIERNAQDFKTDSVYRDELTHFLETRDIGKCTSIDLLQRLFLISQPKKGQIMEISSLLKELGYTRKKNVRVNGKVKSSVFVNAERTKDYPLENFSERINESDHFEENDF